MANRKKGDAITATVIAQYTLVVIGVLITTAFLFFIRDALLMAFGGIIFAVIINGFARIIRRFIPISRGWSIATVGVIFLIVITSFGFLFGSQIVEQFGQLTEKLPQQISQLRETISEWPLGDELMNNDNEQEVNGEAVEQDETNDEENGAGDDLPDDAGGMAFKAGITILDVLTTFGLILIIGIYFVIDPETYRKGIGLFFTKKRAKRITEALDTSGNALWSWLSGQFIVMAFVGIVVTIGLMIIGVPLALLLGIIAGIILATPLAVIAMVLVGMFYVEDVLGKEITIPGREEEIID